MRGGAIVQFVSKYIVSCPPPTPHPPKKIQWNLSILPPVLSFLCVIKKMVSVFPKHYENLHLEYSIQRFFSVVKIENFTRKFLIF